MPTLPLSYATKLNLVMSRSIIVHESSDDELVVDDRAQPQPIELKPDIKLVAKSKPLGYRWPILAGFVVAMAMAVLYVIL